MAKQEEAVFIADQRGRFVFVDDAACRLVGYTRDQLLRLTIRDTYAPEEVYLSEQRIRDIQEGKELTFGRRIRRSDGTYIPVEVRARMLEDGRYRAVVRAT